MTKPIYLDYAAATPLHPEVLAAMRPYLAEKFHNPSAVYKAGRGAREALESARASIAHQLGARQSEIIFTAGGTEANNLAVQGVMRQFLSGELLVSSLEHDSVLEPAKLFKVKQISATSKGLVNLDALARLISNKTVLISVARVNNEVGILQPFREIVRLVKQAREKREGQAGRLPLYLHTDASQAAMYCDLHVSRVGVDMMSINGGKIYGPKQTGALYVKAGVELKPLIMGGGQERAYRSGTENVAGFVGLAKALDLAQTIRTKESLRLTGLRDLFIALLGEDTPNISPTGLSVPRAPHIVHVSIPGIDNERLVIQLDEAGVQCAVGSACSAYDSEPSHVLTAMGMDESSARSSLRFSFGRDTSEGDIKRTVGLLKRFTSAS